MWELKRSLPTPMFNSLIESLEKQPRGPFSRLIAILRAQDNGTANTSLHIPTTRPSCSRSGTRDWCLTPHRVAVTLPGPTPLGSVENLMNHDEVQEGCCTNE